MEADKIRKLIAGGSIEKALNELLILLKDSDESLYEEASLLSGKFQENQRNFNSGVIDIDKNFLNNSQISYAILDITKKAGRISVKKNNGDPGEYNTHKNKFHQKVFISYNHKDTEIANRLRDALEARNIDVIIDSDPNAIGKDIKTFIENSIRDSRVTISVVSKNSLLSAWVAMETINSFYDEKTNSEKKFLACIVENDFLERSFTDEALDIIDKEISDIRKLITDRMEKKRNIGDLQNELRRYTDLQNNIDEIVRRLKEYSYIDISGENLLNNIETIYQAIIN